MSAEKTERDAIVKLTQDCASKLAEHVDSVQIFVTKHSDHGGHNTMSYEYGLGNFYTRQGHIDEWLVIQREYQRAEARRRDAKEHE